MSVENEQLLMTLALECSAAKETLAATEALERYFKNRLKPTQVRKREFSAESDEGQLLLQKKQFAADGKDLRFIFPTQIPLEFTVLGCKAGELSTYEIDTIKKITQLFRERMDHIAELKGLSYTDDLTGLYNQRYLELVLERELSLAKRNDTEFSVLFLDLDHFKNVNDTHGHLIGSRLLYEVGQEIKKTLRESDITFRYGGDEFVLILSHTGLEDAMMVGERIRVQIEKKRFLAKDGMDIRLTASIGVATVPMHAETKVQILNAADEALYGVKKAVRNKVIASTGKAKAKG